MLEESRAILSVFLVIAQGLRSQKRIVALYGTFQQVKESLQSALPYRRCQIDKQTGGYGRFDHQLIQLGYVEDMDIIG